MQQLILQIRSVHSNFWERESCPCACHVGICVEQIHGPTKCQMEVIGQPHDATTLQPGRVPLVLTEEKSVWSPDSVRILWKTENFLPPTRNQTTVLWLPRPQTCHYLGERVHCRVLKILPSFAVWKIKLQTLYYISFFICVYG